jgi:hypothetical protein
VFIGTGKIGQCISGVNGFEMTKGESMSYFEHKFWVIPKKVGIAEEDIKIIGSVRGDDFGEISICIIRCIIMLRLSKYT